jgi:hypothetical protein
MFFFEKKNQKTFIRWLCAEWPGSTGEASDLLLRASHCLCSHRTQWIEVFLLLFLQKKKSFLSPVANGTG